MSSPQLCLRWNNHHPNFILVFKNLLQDEELVDVTLSVDGHKIKAHKVILSACSPYFKQLFSANPCKHPMVVLSDVKFVDLQTIIEFMYCGEIIITDERLPDILEVAEALQIMGLFDPNKKVQERKSEGATSKKKKKEIANKNVMKQSYVSNQKHKSCSDGNRLSQNIGPSVTDWAKEQPNEHEFNSGPLFFPSGTCEAEVNGLYQSEQSTDTLSSPVDHSATSMGPIKRRRHNSKVQQNENLLLAMEAVRTGQWGFCKAAKLYGVNNRTLWLEYKKRGYPTTRSQPLALRQKHASGC